MRPNRGEGRRHAPQWLQAIGAVLARNTQRTSRDGEGRLCRAWGIELDQANVHLVCLSALCGGGASLARICVDEVLHVPLPPGLVDGTDILAPEEVGAMLRDVLQTHPLSDPSASFSMALCPSVVLSRELAWESLLPGYTVTHPETSAVTDALGPWIRWHAQRISGLEDADLLVDWRVSAHDRSKLTLTAAQSHYLSVRDALADHAGIRLQGLVDAAESALRACRFVVAHCLQRPVEVMGGGADGDAGDVSEGEAEPFHLACLWCGETVVKAWTFAADRPGSAALPCTLPAIATVGADAWCVALRTVLHAQEPRPALMIVCGHDPALTALGGMAALTRTVDFPVIRFDASTCRLHCDLPAEAATIDCSVALGAALHGLAGGLVR